MQGGARLTPDFWLADPLGWQVLQGIRLVWGEVMSFVWASLSVRGSGKDILAGPRASVNTSTLAHF